MFQKMVVRMCAIGIAAFVIPATSLAQTVGLFYDAGVDQIVFAAGDVKAALMSKGLSVEVKPLSDLNASYANQKVVIAHETNAAAISLLTAQGGAAPAGLAPEGFVLRTTTAPAKSFWVIGGESSAEAVYKYNGTMYGAFEIAENIKTNGLAGTYDGKQAPYIKERGAKLNLPLDGSSATYTGFNGTAFIKSIPIVWDINFWKAWFDEKARNRYNLVTHWSEHPFSGLVKVPGYEQCALNDLLDENDNVIKKMTIDERIAIWKQIIDYAHARGFKVYFFNWNTMVNSPCEGQNGIEGGGSTSVPTMNYMAASMTHLLKTYPSLDGFGITAGENMDGSESQKEYFCWKAYGEPALNFAKANPGRRFAFIHRFHQTAFSAINSAFSQLISQPNVDFAYSIKYSQAKMLSTTYPTVWAGNVSQVIGAGKKMFFTVRNDDLYFHDWGDPTFARNYIKGMPDKNPAHLQNVQGFYIGSDGHVGTQTWYLKDASQRTGLEIKRLWYWEMVWGRLAYNPNISDDVFKAAIKLRYPQANETLLFDAWCNASKAFQVGNEYIVGKFFFDYMYNPETQMSGDGYRDRGDFSQATPPPGSPLKSAIVAADSAKKCAEAGLAALNSINAGGNAELQSKVRNLQELAILSLYVSEKLRSAYSSGSAASTAAGKAYCCWVEYAKMMDATYVPMSFQRVDPRDPNLFTWASISAEALNDYRSAGGSGTPTCQQMVGASPVSVSPGIKQPLDIRSLSTGAITLYLPAEQGFSLEIFKSNGAKVATLSKPRNNKGVTRFVIGKQLPQGVYMVRLNSANQEMVRQMNVVNK